jgi:hypothetical protein
MKRLHSSSFTIVTLPVPEQNFAAAKAVDDLSIEYCYWKFSP